MTSSTYWEKSHTYHAGAHLVDTHRKYSGTRKTDFKSSMKELKEIGDDAFFGIEVFQVFNQMKLLQEVLSMQHPCCRGRY